MHNVVATLPFDDNLPAAPCLSFSLFLSSSSFLLLFLFLHPSLHSSRSLISIHSHFSLRLVRGRVYESIYVKEKEMLKEKKEIRRKKRGRREETEVEEWF